jgi:Protein kinase domain
MPAPANSLVTDGLDSALFEAARIRATIDHPHLLPARLGRNAEGAGRLVLQECAAPSLRELLSTTRLSRRDAVILVGGVASALSALAEHDLIARDLTPDRVLVDVKRGAILADYGVPLGVSPAGLIPPSDPNRSYRSPEERDGEPLDARSNVYSLGALLMAAVTGRRPPDHLRRRAEPPARDVPPTLEAVVGQAMSFEPERRYRDAAAFAQAAVRAYRASTRLTRAAGSKSAAPSRAAKKAPDGDSGPGAGRATRIRAAKLTRRILPAGLTKTSKRDSTGAPQELAPAPSASQPAAVPSGTAPKTALEGRRAPAKATQPATEGAPAKTEAAESQAAKGAATEAEGATSAQAAERTERERGQGAEAAAGSMRRTGAAKRAERGLAERAKRAASASAETAGTERALAGRKVEPAAGAQVERGERTEREPAQRMKEAARAKEEAEAAKRAERKRAEQATALAKAKREEEVARKREADAAAKAQRARERHADVAAKAQRKQERARERYADAAATAQRREERVRKLKTDAAAKAQGAARSLEAKAARIGAAFKRRAPKSDAGGAGAVGSALAEGVAARVRSIRSARTWSAPTVSLPTPSIPRLGRRAHIALAGSVVIGAVVGAIAAGSGGTEAQVTLSSRVLRLPLEMGWTERAPNVGRSLSLSDSVSASRPGGTVLVAGMMRDPTVTARELGKPLSSDTPRTPVQLGALQAWRYAELHPQSGVDAIAYVAPTSGGTLLVVCRAPSADAARQLRSCSGTASVLRLRNVTPVSLAEFETAKATLRETLEDLAVGRARERRRLASAQIAADQVAAADALADRYRDAAARLASVSVPGESDVPTRVASALEDVSAAYKELSRAAANGNQALFDRARREILAAEAVVRQQFERTPIL